MGAKCQIQGTHTCEIHLHMDRVKVGIGWMLQGAVMRVPKIEMAVDLGNQISTKRRDSVMHKRGGLMHAQVFIGCSNKSDIHKDLLESNESLRRCYLLFWVYIEAFLEVTQFMIDSNRRQNK